MTKLWFLLTFAFSSKYFLQSVSGAEVNINLTDFQRGVVVIPENDQQGTLRVQLTEANISTPVTVICSTLDTGPGLTSVEFTNSTVPVGETEVNVTFRIISPGRPVTIQCSGQSQGNNSHYTFSESKGNNV